MGILEALDEQFPPLEWGASEGEVQHLFPGGRSTPGTAYVVEHTLVGYPFPVVLFFTFHRGLVAITVEYPRTYDMVSGDMQLPGRMVADSIYRHLSALLIIAFGGAPEPSPGLPPPERGDAVLADHAWTTAQSSVRLEFRLQSGLGRVHVEMKALRG